MHRNSYLWNVNSSTHLFIMAMEKEIKTVRMIMLVMGIILAFSNTLGLLINIVIIRDLPSQGIEFLDFILDNFALICLVFFVSGVLSIIASLMLKNRKEISRIFAMFTAVLSFIIVLGFSVFMMTLFPFDEMNKVPEMEGLPVIFGVFMLFGALSNASPAIVVLYYLNKSSVKELFT
ncbi:MAG: hypothetical protein C0592_00945 [Marinilabiliales bacterium]|nr:MAG: hypothetical protein C0592_00945 [Marinilabiliales bacterium]